MRRGWLRVLVLAIAGVGVGAGCLADGSTACADGSVCPAGAVCLVGGGCATGAQDDACPDGAADGSACAFPGVPAGVCRDGFCVASRCGDGVVDPANGESCDAGAANSEAPDAPCRPDCEPARCGDGVVDGGEACDDDNLVSGDGCSGDCASREVCGNEYLDALAGEECDVGAGVSQDGCSSTCGIEPIEWLEWNAPDDRRTATALAYDGAHAVVVMFGGYNDTRALDDTLLWDGRSWHAARTDGAPPGRGHHAMAYDAARGQVVMFGGADLSDALRGDTWLWDGVAWREAAPGRSPPARSDHAMTYDPVRQRVVLFGGLGTDGPLGDTWEWDGTGWSQASPTSAPSARARHGMAYDPVRDRVVLVGPAASSLVAEVWEWTGSNWVARATTARPQGNAVRLIWDTARARLTAFALDPGMLQVRTYTLGGTTWTLRNTLGGGPEYDIAVAMDEARGQGVWFGGSGQIVALAEGTWLWGGTSWTYQDPREFDSPGGRIGPQLVFDPRHGVTLLSGGGNVFGTGGSVDMWTFERGRWHALPLTPAVIAPGVMLTDTVRGRVLAIAAGVVPSVWEWNGATWTGVPSTDELPALRIGAAFAFDPARAEVVVFDGGAPTTPLGPSPTSTWRWDGATWSRATPATAPPPRGWPRMAADPVRGRVVLVGGSGDAGPLRDTWEWDGTQWVQPSPASDGPVLGLNDALVYDPFRRRLVAFTRPADGDRLVEAWEWDGATWTVRRAATGPLAGPYAASFDPIERRMLVVSGAPVSATVSPIWTYRYASGARPAEGCVRADRDDDGDGLAGCADPDCFGRCAPACPPGASCPAGASRCGDGACGTVEDYLLCPADCVPP